LGIVLVGDLLIYLLIGDFIGCGLIDNLLVGDCIGWGLISHIH
jgi:hypothetical protein